jgi:transposase
VLHDVRDWCHSTALAAAHPHEPHASRALGFPVDSRGTDRQDAQHILNLLLEDRFPRIWVPSWENRDVRQLLWHRHRMVQMRTRLMNQLQAVARNEGVRRKKGLWREAGRKQLRLSRWHHGPSRRRSDLLEMLDRLNHYDCRVDAGGSGGSQQKRCGPATGNSSRSWSADGASVRSDHWQAERFRCGNQVASYLGLVPAEDSSGEHRRSGHISKQPTTPQLQRKT